MIGRMAWKLRIVGPMVAVCMIWMQLSATGVWAWVFPVHDPTDMVHDVHTWERTVQEAYQVYQTFQTAIAMKNEIVRQATKLKNLSQLKPKQFLSAAINVFANQWFGNNGKMKIWVNLMDGGFSFEYNSGDSSMSVSNRAQFRKLSEKYSDIWPDAFDPVKDVIASKWVEKYALGDMGLDQYLESALTDVGYYLSLKKAKNIGNMATVASARTSEKDNVDAKEAMSKDDDGNQHQATLDVIKAELQFINNSLEQQNALLQSYVESRATGEAVALNQAGARYSLTPLLLKAIKDEGETEQSVTTTLEWD